MACAPSEGGDRAIAGEQQLLGLESHLSARSGLTCPGCRCPLTVEALQFVAREWGRHQGGSPSSGNTLNPEPREVAMIRTFALWVILGFTLGLCTTAALACEDPVTIPEEESINDHCPGQSVPSCTIINPAVIEDQYDDDWYSFEVNAGTLITAGTDDPGGAPDTETIIELWHSNCSTMFAQDYHSGPRYFSLIYQFGAPYTGTYNLRVRGVYDPHPQPYEAFIYCGGSPIGACCLPSGDCLLTDRVQCAWEDGLFYGAGTTCDSVECPGVPVNDLCSGAIVIPTPGFGVLSGNSYHAHDNYNPWSPSCIDIPARGNDVVYRFDLELGDIVDLTYTQLESDASVYIVTDCARVRTSCVAGADEASYREPETLHYVAGTPIPGACCYEDHHCEILLEEICADSGGYWLGVWTDCDPNDCFDLWGVCCPPDWRDIYIEGR